MITCNSNIDDLDPLTTWNKTRNLLQARQDRFWESQYTTQVPRRVKCVTLAAINDDVWRKLNVWLIVTGSSADISCDKSTSVMIHTDSLSLEPERLFQSLHEKSEDGTIAHLGYLKYIYMQVRRFSIESGFLMREPSTTSCTKQISTIWNTMAVIALSPQVCSSQDFEETCLTNVSNRKASLAIPKPASAHYCWSNDGASWLCSN